MITVEQRLRDEILRLTEALNKEQLRRQQLEKRLSQIESSANEKRNSGKKIMDRGLW